MRSKLFACLILSAFFQYSFGQELKYTVPNHVVGISLTQFISDIEKKGDIKFFYLPEWTNDIILTTSYKDQPITTALETLVRGKNITIEFLYGYGIVLLKDTSADEIRQGVLSSVEGSLDTHTFGNFYTAKWGEDVVFNGKITTENFSEPIIGATVFANEVQKGSITNTEGLFNIELPVGDHLITIKSPNYIDQNFFIKLYDHGNLDIVLEGNPFMLDEIVISDNASRESFDNAVSGVMRITAKDLEKMPATMGEVDVIKSIQILPGVNSVGEGSAGFNVRGGSADQNLILLDNGIIFNPNHLFGFFSAFQSDAIQDVTFYRGAIPVQYGGRISSVLDVKQKNGDKSQLKASGGLGLISSRLMVEGPLSKDKVSFMVGGRTSYSDWILRSVKEENVRESSAFFYDFTAKVSANLDEKNKISASIYGSKDKFKFADDTVYFWQNSSVAINHEKIIRDDVTHFNSLSFGKYSYEVRDEDAGESFSWKYGIKNFQLKSYRNWKKNNHLFTAGVDVTGFEFERGKIEPLSGLSIISPIELENDFSLTSGLFFSDEIQLGKLSIIPGLRLSAFNLFGPNNEYVYDPDEIRDDSQIIDTIRHEGGNLAKTYFGLEPRISAKYNIDLNNFIKLSVSRNYQYLHLISNTAAITPVDSWVPSSEHLKPQIGYQYAIGFFRKFEQAKLIASVEAFYKSIDNVPEYKSGAQVTLKQNIETELVNSHADIRGVEVSLTRQGRLSGQINYTYTSSRRQTITSFESLQINNNNFYPSNYDQPHNLKISTNYDVSKRMVFSMNFNLVSGRPISAPTEKFEVDGIPLENFPKHNQFRIPTYHRLDLSILMRTSHKKNKRWEGSWTFTLTNVYGRRNAYSIFFGEAQEGQRKVPKAFKLSVLGAALPSITYNFRFK